ncbi:MAG: hypothetical protein ACN6O2_09050 [Stenotrophomonas sp.]
MNAITREELDDQLHGLRVRAARIARDYAPKDQVDAVAGEAEVIEQLVAPKDLTYFHNRVEEIIWECGMLERGPEHE